MRKRKTANEELFELVLRHWQSLRSERERASFFVEVVLRDERFTDLLPFMATQSACLLPNVSTNRTC